MTEVLMSRARESIHAGTVSPAYLSVVLDYGQSVGVPIDAQLEAIGLERNVLDATGTRIPAVSYLNLLDWLEKQTGDCKVGLHAGAHFQPRHYAEMGYVVLTTPTVRDAILQGIRFEVLANDIARTRLIESSGGATMTWQPVHGPLSRHAYELHTATWTCFSTWLVGDRHVARLVEFPFPAPADSREHERIFGCPVRFDAARQAVHLSLEHLSMPSLQADCHMQRRMVELAESQMRLHVDRAGSEIAQARAFIGANLPHGEPPITAVAAHLCIPVRTLQRRLGAQGLSYSALLDDLRRELAMQFLGDPKLSLAQLAMRLGFSEQSAFTHAFKRWTQETPNAWRRRRLASTDADSNC
jgi:AraC-like DNA-binding protein